MGQDLLNPPTVEGWHTGKEWIDSGTLVERVNFAAGEMGRIDSPGIRSIIDRFASEGETISAERLVDGCLEMLGGYDLMEETRTLLLNHAQATATLHTSTAEFAQSVGQMLHRRRVQEILAHIPYLQGWVIDSGPGPSEIPQ